MHIEKGLSLGYFQDIFLNVILSCTLCKLVYLHVYTAILVSIKNSFPPSSQPCIMPCNNQIHPCNMPTHIAFHFWDPCSPWLFPLEPLITPDNTWFFFLTWWLIQAIIVILAPLGCKLVIHGHRITPCQPDMTQDTSIMPMGIVYITRLTLPEFKQVSHSWDMVYIILNYLISISTMIHVHLHGLSKSLAPLLKNMQCASLNRRWNLQVAWATEAFSTTALPFTMVTGYPLIGSQEWRQSYKTVKLSTRKPLQAVLVDRSQPKLMT